MLKSKFKVKRKRLILKVALVLLIIGTFLGIAFFVSKNISENKKKEPIVPKPATTSTKPATTTKVTITKKDEKVINIYGYILENSPYESKRIIIDSEKSIEAQGVEYTLYGRYVCKTENCTMKSQVSFDLTTVVINDGGYLAYNFKTKEVAYAFYLAYALKLTDRILEVGPNNKVANDMADNVYNTYYNSLKKKNTYLKSEVIESVVKDLKIRVDERK